MAKRRLLTTMALAAGMLAAAPEGASAQSIDLQSSMQARCVTASCDVVDFMISVPDQTVNGVSYVDNLLNKIDILSSSAMVWKFSAVTRVWHFVSGVATSLYESTGTGWKWSASVDESGNLSAAAASANALHSKKSPIFIRTTMEVATPSQLIDGTLTYTANGYVNGTVTSDNLFSTKGTVTPEPVSMLLLGSGLAGVGAVRRRRRKESELAA